MDIFLRTLEPNLAHRRLRSLLYHASEDLGADLHAIPNSFDTKPLIAHAEKVSRRRDLRQTEYFHELIERLGIVQALNDQDDEAVKTFDRGLRSAERTPDEARFLYLIAHAIHFRKGDQAAARKVLYDAVARMETQRHLKTRALLLLGRVERVLGDLESAEEAYQHVLESGVLEFRPLALNYMSIVRMAQKDFDEAKRLNRKASSLLKRARSQTAARQAERQLGLIHLETGDARAARKVFQDAVQKDLALLDLGSAGRAYNNLAVACARLNDHRGAQDASLEAIRCHAALGRTLLVSQTYQNLGRALSRSGQSDSAMAALEKSAELAKKVGSTQQEFGARTEALRNILESRRHKGVVSVLVNDCTEILDKHASSLTRDALESFAEVMGHLTVQGVLGDVARQRGRRPRHIATDAGRATLNELTGAISADEFDRKLAERLGQGLSGRYVPPTPKVASFLMLFTGDSFRFGEYAREFLLPTSRAKTQLKELCQRRILEMTGTRKAAKYFLSFHRAL